MNILALDASTEYCSVALWRDGETEALGERAGQRHSELLLPMADRLLARHGLRVKALDGIAFGQGPGSFTGLRIACGLAQGLAFGAGLPVVGVGTLAAMAEACGAARVVCALDARMGEVYLAAYSRAGEGWGTVQEPMVCAPPEAPELPAGSWVGCGGGFAALGGALERRYAGRLARVEPGIAPHAREIARLAARELEQGRAQPAQRAAPLYLRDKVALRMDER
ncbi:MAG TPA: tRNA (adenosine(37)-N6)-threonylcarbamoyltransferase complex dimerization subunit type 1 TsaB [Burkholderiales bacterium]|nr:tRNA (adenosine(37)-N6)-threonylcarbamoyltransferase complex dimerization subunit type 1 TsaB [Burkholderiales bacterium]